MAVLSSSLSPHDRCEAAGSKLQAAGCRLQAADSRVQGSGCEIELAEPHIRLAHYAIGGSATAGSGLAIGGGIQRPLATCHSSATKTVCRSAALHHRGATRTETRRSLPTKVDDLRSLMPTIRGTSALKAPAHKFTLAKGALSDEI